MALRIVPIPERNHGGLRYAIIRTTSCLPSGLLIQINCLFGDWALAVYVGKWRNNQDAPRVRSLSPIGFGRRITERRYKVMAVPRRATREPGRPANRNPERCGCRQFPPRRSDGREQHGQY